MLNGFSNNGRVLASAQNKFSSHDGCNNLVFATNNRYFVFILFLRLRERTLEKYVVNSMNLKRFNFNLGDFNAKARRFRLSLTHFLADQYARLRETKRRTRILATRTPGTGGSLIPFARFPPCVRLRQFSIYIEGMIQIEVKML